MTGRGAGEAIWCNTATLEYSQGHLHKGKAYIVYFLKERRKELTDFLASILNHATFVEGK
jgi:hypothetical protein